MNNQIHQLDCLEVWGGSDRAEEELRVTGLDVSVWSRPADDVLGGDLYFVSMCACAEVSRFLVADVTGHDASSAEVAKRLRRIMHKHINKPDQSRLVCSLNKDFDGMRRHQKFATAVLATFFPPSQHLIFCNAGHPRPLWYRAASGQWSWLDPELTENVEQAGNLPLGIHGDTPYEQSAVRLEPNDLVLFYTDGFTELRDSSGNLLGEDGLLDALQQIGSQGHETLGVQLRQRLGIDTAENTNGDDMTMLLLRANGDQPPRQALSEKFRVMAKMLGLLPTR